MSEYIIRGGAPLRGEVTVSGAKNAALPILCASLLCAEGETVLNCVPDITDVRRTLRLLEELGCETSFTGGQVRINAERARYAELSGEAARLRSAALFLGAACGRFGRAVQPFPGGCELGSRPIDLHIAAFGKMGIAASQNDMIECVGRPHGADIFLAYPSVGATENAILAAALGEGTVTITGAAREPEIEDTADFLNACGARISGAGGRTIIVQGVEKLRGTRYSIMGDRIEAATFLAAAAATGGEVTVRGFAPEHIAAFTDVLVRAGVSVCRGADSVTVTRGDRLRSPGIVETAPYPGFPTDGQSVTAAMLLRARGVTEIRESIFDDRLKVCRQFRGMGASIAVRGRRAVIEGTGALSGAKLTACDLRSGAALAVAALQADGESRISGTTHIERGYESFAQKLRALGANVRTV